ncbi:conserved repeat domain-containing protein/gliding motility-associated C-terminal domain-containing protein, partial [Lutibacter oricola]
IAATNQASEPNSNGLFTVSLSNAVSTDTEVTFTVTGTATEGTDYATIGTTVTIPANTTTATISVTVIDDNLVETAGETVVVTLTGTNTAVTLDTTVATVTISDEDGVTININDVVISEGDVGITKLEFTVSLTNESNVITTIDYQTYDGTAQLADNDYVAIPVETLTFLPGEISKTVEVDITTDNKEELDEVFTITLSNLNSNGNNLVIGKAIGIGTIINDDYSPIIVDVVVSGIEDNDVDFTLGDFITSFDDEDGDSLESIIIVSLPDNGVLYLNEIEVLIGDVIIASEINSLTFTPNLNWNGTVTFDYNSSDGVNIADSNEQVIITITEVNDLPIANDDIISTEQDVAIVGASVANNDNPSDDGGNIWSLVGDNGGALNGTVIMNAEGVYTYEPDEYFYGTDSFVYVITDADGDSSNAVVTITVNLKSEPSLELIKTASIGGEEVGDIITYTFTVFNTGNVNLSNVVISDPLISDSPIAVVGLLEPYDNATVDAYYTITQEDIDNGSVSNTATVICDDVLGNKVSDVSDNGDAVDGDDNPTITELEQKPSIAIIKTAIFNDDNSDGYAQAGETITYSFTIRNIGNVALSNITVVDPLPGVTVYGNSITLEAGEVDDSTFTATYSITQDDINNGSVTNQASVSGSSIKGIVVSDSSDDKDEYGDNPTVLTISGCVIEVFNAVSPNDDGENDVFYIRGIECYSDNRVEIYNRWGGLVFERDHYNNTDRAFKGISEGRLTIHKSRELPDGAYYYILKYKGVGGKMFKKAGYLYINRR